MKNTALLLSAFTLITGVLTSCGEKRERGTGDYRLYLLNDNNDTTQVFQSVGPVKHSKLHQTTSYTFTDKETGNEITLPVNRTAILYCENCPPLKPVTTAPYQR